MDQIERVHNTTLIEDNINTLNQSSQFNHTDTQKGTSQELVVAVDGIIPPCKCTRTIYWIVYDTDTTRRETELARNSLLSLNLDPASDNCMHLSLLYQQSLHTVLWGELIENRNFRQIHAPGPFLHDRNGVESCICSARCSINPNP